MYLMAVCTRFHFRRLSYLVWSVVLLSLPCFQNALRSQDDPFAPEPSTATWHILVVDPEGRPIPNAMFQEELSLSFDQMAESPISVATDVSGVLKVIREKRLDWGIWGSVYSPGFAIAIHYASSLDSPRRRKVKLVPEDAIAVEVFDEHGIAESNALVAPSLWIRNPLVNPHRTMHCRTDANGNASLLGSKKQELKAVRIEMPNRGGRDYLIPKSWDKETPLQLKWSTFQSSLDVKVVDSMGNAVPKVAVLVKSKDEDANENVIAEPTVVYWRRAWSDENGVCPAFILLPTFPLLIQIPFSPFAARVISATSNPVGVTTRQLTWLLLRFLADSNGQPPLRYLKSHAGIHYFARLPAALRMPEHKKAGQPSRRLGVIYSPIQRRLRPRKLSPHACERLDLAKPEAKKKRLREKLKCGASYIRLQWHESNDPSRPMLFSRRDSVSQISDRYTAIRLRLQ